MTLQRRPYQDPADVIAMRQLLVAGAHAHNGTYYVHPGDLDWWLHKPPKAEERRRNILLWQGDSPYLAAWALWTPNEGAIDVFVHPTVHGTATHQQVFDEALMWAETRAREIKGLAMQNYWIDGRDAVMRAMWAARGFTPDDALSPHFTRDLGALPAMLLPEGFVVGGVTDLERGRQRAEATHGAFGADRPWEPYWAQYQQFMNSVAYEGERDLVVVSPDGRGAAACTIWFDAVNQMGLFEPVGTHPDFQGRGLGKAVMAEGLRRMKAAGMKHAMVSTNAGNVAACALYQSMGFQLDFEFVNYRKSLE